MFMVILLFFFLFTFMQISLFHFEYILLKKLRHLLWENQSKNTCPKKRHRLLKTYWTLQTIATSTTRV